MTCNAGERVLLRFANLGFREAAMTLAGIKMKVIGKDATPMRGIGVDGYTRNGANTSYDASTVSFGAGESIDAIFTAPAFSGGLGSSGLGYDAYPLYDRAYERTNNLGNGGRRTEVRVYPGRGHGLLCRNDCCRIPEPDVHESRGVLPCTDHFPA